MEVFYVSTCVSYSSHLLPLPLPWPHPLHHSLSTPEPPPSAVTIVLISNDTEIDAGNTVLLTCVATGIPIPEISWLKNNAPLVTDDRVFTLNETIDEGNITFVRSVLEICDSGEDDTATYTCVAYVPQLTATANVNLTVNTAPAVITVPPENQTIITGSDVMLSCAAIGAPLPSILWRAVTAGGNEVVNSSSVTISTAVSVEGGVTTVRSTLSLTSVVADAGYGCTASNEFGSETETAYISVQGKGSASRDGLA